VENNAQQKVVLNPTPTRTVKVQARGELFRIVQLQGNLFVCSKAHGSCCCGWTEKERAPVNLELYEEEWERRRIRNKIHLTFTGCLGPCAVGNNALLQLSGRSIWFKDLNDDKYIPMLFDYVELLLKDLRAVPPLELKDHIYERYLPVSTTDATAIAQPNSLITPDEDEVAEAERLDPVCLMDVDPATTKWKSEYAGRNFYFCAPACKKKFDREPQAYV
jgi:YHS domain-containing protein